MSPGKILFTSTLFLLCASCKDLTLLHRNINYKVPSKDEMTNVYEKNRNVFDSIAQLSFLLIDKKEIKDLSIGHITVCNENVNFSGSSGQCTLSEIEGIEANNEFATTKNEIQKYKKQVRMPDCIEIYLNRVEMPYKKVKETIKSICYQRFIYVRNGEPMVGDSIAVNVCAD